MFPYQPPLTQYLNPALSMSGQVGDVRQPWRDLAGRCGVSEFSAKALFSIGLMLRYIDSANAVLSAMRHEGLLSAFELMASSIELLGRCIHANELVRQHPNSRSGERLDAGFEFMRPAHLPATVVVETNYRPFSGEDLKALRNFTTHGASIDVTTVRADIELLHEMRKAFIGVIDGEDDPHRGRGPVAGAIDRFFEQLAAGDVNACERLASAAITPAPLSLHGGGWPFADQVVSAVRNRIEANRGSGRLAVAGGYSKSTDGFQRYP